MRRFGLFVSRHEAWVGRAAWALFALQAATLLSRSAHTSARAEDLLSVADGLLAAVRRLALPSRPTASPRLALHVLLRPPHPLPSPPLLSLRDSWRRLWRG